jgi:flavin reductase (DIM6/NTAB) family NADH-FMN oxidoreductase RutF
MDPAAPSHVIAQPETLYVGGSAYLIATENADGSANLSPASSYWALGRTIVLGLEGAGRTVQNLLERPDLTVNFPSGDLVEAVLRLDGTTGCDPVPAGKERYRYEADKFGVAGLTPQDSDLVSVPRVAECRLQFEARVVRTTPGHTGEWFMVEAEVLRVHADPRILKPGTGLPDPRRWSPLVYEFRHFFTTGEEQGHLPASLTA